MISGRAIAAFVASCCMISGCSTVELPPLEKASREAQAPLTPRPTPGGFYLDDGPGDAPPDNLDALPDAVPRVESLHRASLKPYSALGRDYLPMTSLVPYRARGTASWYGRRYHGKPTASGEKYDMYQMTAAHTTLPLPSYVRVTCLENGKSVVVRVNDRGPFREDRLIDLSYVAAHRLGLVGSGSGLVEIETIIPAASPSKSIVQTPPAAGPVATTDREIGADQGIYLQFGAFAERRSADSFAMRMQSEAPDLLQPIRVREVDGLHRVQAGPFPDRDSAFREANRLSPRLGSRPFVVGR